jgi:hypothetical protein
MIHVIFPVLHAVSLVHRRFEGLGVPTAIHFHTKAQRLFLCFNTFNQTLCFNTFKP